MHPLTDLLQEATAVGELAFVKRHAGWALLFEAAKVGPFQSTQTGILPQVGDNALTVVGQQATAPREHGPLTRYVELPMPSASGPRLCTIGRLTTNTIVISGAMVSKEHATIVVHPQGTVEILDHGSRNGTYVNAQRLAAMRASPVADGDTVVFGSLPCLLADGARLWKFVIAQSSSSVA